VSSHGPPHVVVFPLEQAVQRLSCGRVEKYGKENLKLIQFPTRKVRLFVFFTCVAKTVDKAASGAAEVERVSDCACEIEAGDVLRLVI